jgi:pimeloyl-ACP methyl ester carboxylesterase
VVLDGGHRERGDFWNVSDPASPKATPVLAGVQQFTRVCTYDRPGTVVGSAPKDFSRSDPVPMPRNAAAAVTDLHELLSAAKVPGPYVLVGHSFGGLDILLYALNYPRSVAGIVFVDALPPQLRNQMTPSLWKTYSELNAQPLPGLDYKELETMDFSASIDQVQRALARTTLPAIPIVVLTKDRPFDLAGREVPAGFGEKLDAAWRRAQRQLAASIAHVPLTVVETSHNISIERPDVVIDAIRRVVEAVRSGRKTVTQ